MAISTAVEICADELQHGLCVACHFCAQIFIVEVCEAFCATVRNAGYQSGVYASRNWYNKMIEVERLDRYVTWLAEYRKVPLYEGYYHMWQYTSKGKVDGIEGNVDLNISYLGY